MNDHCPFENDVVKSADRNQWPESLRQHAGGCDVCSAAAAVTPWMHRFARTADRQHKLPDPAVVWLKAQLLRNTFAAERASRPMTAVQVLAYMVVAGGWAALLMWKWESLRATLLTLDPSRWLSGTIATGTSAGLSGSFLMTLLTLATVTIILGFHTVLAED